MIGPAGAATGAGQGAGAARPGLLRPTPADLQRLLRTQSIDALYEVEADPFASGQFACVRRCRLLSSGHRFAAKFSARMRYGDDCTDELRSEVALLALCAPSPRIVRLHEVFETPRHLIMVLEYAPGGDLQAVLDDNMVPFEQDAVRFVRQTLEALVFLHKHSVAHLDIKPQNLVLTGEFPDGDVKLCDFEVSRRIEKGVELREILGTPDYVAPEILHYEPITLAADMWSLGVTTYALLTGFSPFGGESDQETFCNIAHAQLDFPEELFEDVSDDARDFIRQLLVRDPTSRPSAAECLRHVWLRRGPARTESSASLPGGGDGEGQQQQQQQRGRELRRFLSKSREALVERAKDSLRRGALLSQSQMSLSRSREKLYGLRSLSQSQDLQELLGRPGGPAPSLPSLLPSLWRLAASPAPAASNPELPSLSPATPTECNGTSRSEATPTSPRRETPPSPLTPPLRASPGRDLIPPLSPFSKPSTHGPTDIAPPPSPLSKSLSSPPAPKHTPPPPPTETKPMGTGREPTPPSTPALKRLSRVTGRETVTTPKQDGTNTPLVTGKVPTPPSSPATKRTTKISGRETTSTMPKQDMSRGTAQSRATATARTPAPTSTATTMTRTATTTSTGKSAMPTSSLVSPSLLRRVTLTPKPVHELTPYCPPLDPEECASAKERDQKPRLTEKQPLSPKPVKETQQEQGKPSPEEKQGSEEEQEEEEPRYSVAQLISAFNRHQEHASKNVKLAEEGPSYPKGTHTLRSFIDSNDKENTDAAPQKQQPQTKVTLESKKEPAKPAVAEVNGKTGSGRGTGSRPGSDGADGARRTSYTRSGSMSSDASLTPSSPCDAPWWGPPAFEKKQQQQGQQPQTPQQQKRKTSLPGKGSERPEGERRTQHKPWASPSPVRHCYSQTRKTSFS